MQLHKIRTLLLTGLLLLNIVNMTSLLDNGFMNDKYHLSIAYTDSPPIIIDGNFSASALANGWNGNGTIGNPYIIEGLRIVGDSTNNLISITNSNAYFIIDGCDLSDGLTGIYLSSTQNGIIRNNTVSNCGSNGIHVSTVTSNIDILSNYFEFNQFGLALNLASDIRIDNNTFISNNFRGISISNSDNLVISNNTITLSFYYGIKASSTVSSVFHNNSISNATAGGIYGHGLYLETGSLSNIISKNEIFNNFKAGITLTGTADNLITDNYIHDNGEFGINIDSNNDINVTDNLISNNIDKGIEYTGCWDGFIIGNTLVNHSYAIRLSGSTGTNVQENKISGQTSTGIAVSSSGSNEILENEIFSPSTGIYFSFASNSEIRNNNVTQATQYGIFIGGGTNYTLNNNRVVNSGIYGIYLTGADYNFVNKNYLENSGWAGLYLSTSVYNSFDQNTFINDGMAFSQASDLWDYPQTSFTSNTVNGKPLRFLYSQESQTISTPSGQIILVNCTDITIQDQDLTQTRYNLQAYLSSFLTITGNNFSDSSGPGVQLFDTHNSSITWNSFTDNYGSGILLWESSDNLIEFNQLQDLTATGFSSNGPGISLDNSPNCVVRFNNLSKIHNYGIRLHSLDSAVVVNNSIEYTLNSAFYIGGVLTSEISNNSLRNNRAGLTVFDTDHSNFTNNFVDNSSVAAIFLKNSENNRIDNNILISGGLHLEGLSLSEYDQVSVSGNTVNGRPLIYWKSLGPATVSPGAGQVILVSCTDITVSNQDLSFVPYGLIAAYSTGVSLLNSFIQNTSQRAALFDNSNNVIINNNDVFNNFYGIDLVYCPNSVITDNNFYDNDQTGLRVIISENSLIDNNRFDNCGFTVENANHDTNITNNLVENARMIAMTIWTSDNVRVSNNILRNNDQQGTSIGYCDNLYFEGNEIFGNGLEGISILSSDFNVLIYNYIHDNAREGIHVRDSLFTTINSTILVRNSLSGINHTDSSGLILANCLIENNTRHGVFLANSGSHLLTNNTIRSNLDYGIYLVDITSSELTLNLIESNAYGIYHYSADDNILSYNQFVNNVQYGINFNDSLSNQVMANDFIGNNAGGSQCFANERNFFTFNYWNDWVSQTTDIDNNGILDEPYPTDGPLTNYDFYPLTKSLYATNIPASPPRLYAYPSTSSVYLNWTEPVVTGGSPITGYFVYRGTSYESLELIYSTSSLFFNDTSILKGVTYYYTITAVNSAGESLASNFIVIHLAVEIEISVDTTYTTIFVTEPVSSTEETTTTKSDASYSMLGFIFALVTMSVVLARRRKK